MEQPETPVTLPSDALVVTAICFGWALLSSIQAVMSGFPVQGFSDSTFLSMVVIEVVLGATAIGYLRIRGYGITHLIPVPTAKGSLIGLVLYGMAVVAYWILYALLGKEASASQPIEEMIANSTVSLVPLVVLSVVNGMYEEIFLVGCLQRAFENFGGLFAVGIAVLVRVSYHLYQGPAGVLFILGFGLVLSLYFLVRRQLWPLVFAHMFADLAGMA